ncbi:MAG: FmdB family transcriptional regulator [Acidimicrobiia bacterium]|nr:FmdB family transcriptional regulator [Acidimicrobiia bacterium]
MPTYEYACQKCGNHFEVVHGFKDKPPKKCEACGGALQKVFHPVGIVFKGSGFYKTDSRKSDKSGKTEKTPAAAKSDSGSSSKASDSTSGSTSTSEKSEKSA